MNGIVFVSLPLLVACGTRSGEPRDARDSWLEVELLSIEG